MEMIGIYRTIARLYLFDMGTDQYIAIPASVNISVLESKELRYYYLKSEILINKSTHIAHLTLYNNRLYLLFDSERKFLNKLPALYDL
jgi:hypothetical protein